jgi:hypothetical protein
LHPTSLEASGTSSSTVLNWTASEDPAVTAYNVYKFSTTTQNGIVNEPGYLGTTTSTTYPVTGLTSSTEYSFTVKQDEAGNLSEATNEVTVTTKVLSPPTALAAETTSSSTV